MEPFNYNEYLKNNPLLKEEEYKPAEVLVGDTFTPQEMGYTQTGFGTVDGPTYTVVADLGNDKFECEDKSGSKKIFTKREIQMSARPRDQYYRK